jgi:hypothetical protein
VLGRLEHDRVAAQDGWEDLPGHVRHRCVERDEERRNAERLTHGHHGPVLHGRGRSPAVVAASLSGDEESHLHCRIRLCEGQRQGLPSLFGNELRRLVAARPEKQGELADEVATLDDHSCRPARLRRTSGGNRFVDIGRARARHQAEHGPIRRSSLLDVTDGSDEAAVDQVRGLGCEHGHRARILSRRLRSAAVIVTQIKGRLGNQMFQYAAGRRLADRHGAELVLDTSWIVQARRGTTYAPYELGCFDHGALVCPVWEVARVPNPRRAVYALQRLRPSRRRFVFPLHEDTSTNAFLPRVLTAPDQTYLLGYWQFEDYFADDAQGIRRAFAFRPASWETERLAAEIRASPAVSVHVRRTDYTRHPQLGFLDEAYYERAVAAIAEAAGDVRLFVFSDDPGWCAEHLRLPHATIVIERTLPAERAWEDMYLMSLCRHHVISNSTFSWWGAWLNPSSDKLVIAPEHWILSPKRIGDPIPSHWVRV